MKNRVSKILVFCLLVLVTSPQPAHAASLTTSFTIQEYTWDDSGTEMTLEIQHPSKIICANASYCSISVKYRYIDAFTDFGYFAYLKDSSGHQGSLYATDTSGEWVSAKVTVWNLSTISDVKLSWELSLGIDKLVSSDIKYTLVKNTPATQGYVLPTVWPTNTISSTSWTGKLRGVFPFVQVAMGTSLNANAKCQKVRIVAAPIDVINGYSASNKDDYTVSVAIYDQFGSEVSKTQFASGTWSSEDESQAEAQLCGVKDQKGKVTNFSTKVNYSMIYEGVTYSGTGSGNLVFKGLNKYTKINCLKGSKVKVVKAFKPKCPAGYKKTKLKVVGGQLAPTTIVCAKGLQTKKITGVLPGCPAGWKRR